MAKQKPRTGKTVTRSKSNRSPVVEQWTETERSEHCAFMVAQAERMAQQEHHRLQILESTDRMIDRSRGANHEFLPKADERNSGCNAPSGQPTKAQLIASPSISEKTLSLSISKKALSLSISEKTLIRIMDQAGVERRLNGIEPKMRRFWPDEIDRMIEALEKGNFNQHEELIKKFSRWASQPKH